MVRFTFRRLSAVRRHLDEGRVEREEVAAVVLAAEKVVVAAEKLTEEVLKRMSQSPGPAKSGVTGSG